MKVFPWQKPYRGTLLNTAHPLSKGLVGCWVMNEGAGEKVFDSSGNRYHMDSVNSFVWNPDGPFFDNALSQRLVNSSIPVITGDSSSFSLVIFANVFDLVDLTSALCGDNSGNRWSFKAEQHSNTGKVGWTFKGVADYATNIPTPTGEDSFFAATRTGGSATIDIYVDSLHEALTVGTMPGPSTGLQIAAATSVNHFHGGIKVFYAYNRKLTPAEIKSLHQDPYQMFVQKSIGFGLESLIDDVVLANYSPLIQPGFFHSTFFNRGFYTQDFWNEYGVGAITPEGILKATQSWVYRTQMRK